MTETYQALNDQFSAVFGPGPAPAACFAPGRVNLIGEHTDYNGGHVLPCALDMGISVLARPNSVGAVRMYSANLSRGSRKTAPVTGAVYDPQRGWGNYPAGVIRSLENRGFVLPCGVDLFISGSVPNGAGLSSSAALEVSVACALHMLFFPQLTPEEMAFAGQEAENRFIGVQTGIMDQFASAMCRADHALFLKTADMSFTHVPLCLEGCTLVLINTNKRHSLASSAYNQRRLECSRALEILRPYTDAAALCDIVPAQFAASAHHLQEETLLRRARHAVTENARTIEAANDLAKGDLAAFGRLMNASHISLRDDYAVTCPELDVLAEAAWAQPYVLGARMTGGGFGGCTVNLVRSDSVPRFIRETGRIYTQKTGLQAAFYTAAPGPGVHSIS